MYAGFVNGVINAFAMHGQCKVMPAMRTAEENLILMCKCACLRSEWILGGGVPNIVLRPNFLIDG